MICIVSVVQTAMGKDSPAMDGESGFIREIRLGILGHDVDRMWSNLRRENGIDYNAELTFFRPSVDAFQGIILPSIGASLNDSGFTSKVYAGILWEREHSFGLFYNIGIGLAWHNGELETDQQDRKSLGTRFCFRVPCEVGFSISRCHRVSVAFDHISNGYLASPNEGLDTLGIRYGYRF